MSKLDLIIAARLKSRGKLNAQKDLTGKTFAILDLDRVVMDEDSEDERVFYAALIQFDGMALEKYAVGGALVLDMLEVLERGKNDLPVWATQTTVRTRRGQDAYTWELHEDTPAGAAIDREGAKGKARR